MLGLMRQLTQNKFAGGILFGLVILSMAVWGPGLSDVFSGGFGTQIIQAGDRSATEQQINRKFENYLNNVRREDPSNSITRQQAAEQGILDQVFNVERSRLTNLGYARQLGADASAKALLEDVNAIDAFQNPLTNEFDRQYYRNALSRIDVTPREFESDTQDRLTLDYVRDGINAAIAPPNDIARVQAIFDGEVRYISWFPIAQSNISELPEPSEEALRTFYDTQSAVFEEPERRALTLLNLSADDFVHQADVTEEDIVQAYEATKYQRLAVAEQRTFVEYSFSDEAAARNASAVLGVGGNLPESNDFTQITRTLSQDQVAIEEFREQLFTQGIEVGAVAGPFSANGSWIVGQIVEITPGTPKTLDETRAEVAAELAAEQAELAYYAALNEIDDLIGQGLNAEEIGAEFGAPVVSFAPVDARGLSADGTFFQSLLSSPEAFRQAFELTAGEMTDRFDEDVSTVLISIDEIVPKTTPPFEANSGRIKAAYNISKQGEALKATADLAKATLEGDNTVTMESQAAQFDAEVERPERGLRRTAFDRSLPPSVLRAAFTLDEKGVSVVEGQTPAELIVVKLERIDRPAASELDVLAPISGPKITEQLNQDLLFAFELEVQSVMDTKLNSAVYNAYKTRLIADQ